MVIKMDTKRFIEIICSWLKKLPDNTVRVSQQDDNYEYVLKIKPVKPKACPVQIMIGKHDAFFTVALAQNIQFDDIELSEESLLDILEAVKKGNVEETIVEKNGELISSRGVLSLANNTWFSNRSDLWNRIKSYVGKENIKKTVKYDPWI